MDALRVFDPAAYPKADSDAREVPGVFHRELEEKYQKTNLSRGDSLPLCISGVGLPDSENAKR
jgi:hypothetical protein